MLKKHLYDTLISHFEHQPTDDQLKLFEVFSEFYFSPHKMPVLIINGYAGTGKTSALATISEVLTQAGLKHDLLASTGRAAKVLSSFCKKNAYTVHKKIYRQKSFKDGSGTFVLNANLTPGHLYIVDEASMIATGSGDSVFGSGNLLTDLVDFVFSNENCRLILSGDEAQLPPVNENLSPALNQQILERLGCTVFYVSLSQITRQSLDSGILVNATRLRTGLELSMFNRISFTVAGYPDIRRTDSKDIQQEIESCYDKYGMDETVIICRSNKMANKYNEFIRNRILYREEALSCSDKLLVVKNNYFWLPENENTEFIANGDFVILRKIRRIHEMHGFNFADCTVDFPDYNMEFEVKLLLESIRAEGPGISADQSRELYNAVSLDYSHIANKRKRYEKLLEDPYYNALQTKMGYAMTCHKAQGGQWKAVFVDFSFFSQDSDNPETFRWLYTAITRATERLYLVNFKDMYFDNED